MSPPKSSATATTLEEKLELLEARFTQPLTQLHRGTVGDIASLSIATNEHSNVSEHSFAFAASNSVEVGESSNEKGIQPVFSPTSYSNNSANSQTLERVHQATAKHIQKVAAAAAASTATSDPAFMVTTRTTTVSSPLIHSNSSQQTLVTGNHQFQEPLRHQSLQPHPNRVVAESPPMLVSPPPNGATMSSSKNHITYDEDIMTTSTQNTPVARTLLTSTSNVKTTTKRKPQQPKRKVSSVKDSLDEMRNGGQETIAVAAPTITTTTAVPPISSTTNKRARISSESPTINHTHSRDSLTTTTTASRSPRLSSDHSRDRGLSGKNKRTGANTSSAITAMATSSNAIPPPNNKRILDFFFAVTKHDTHNTNKETTPGMKSSLAAAATVTNNGNSHKKLINHESTGSIPNSTSTLATTLPTTTSNAVSTTIDCGWEEQCYKLEQQLQDKEEQLKAVTNNKTILHTALQSALQKTQQELKTLQQTIQQRQHDTHVVLEDLLRWRSQQQAKELRETLAVDGARLGKIVYSRAGMRTVESWEEGYATKELQLRKDEWKRKKKALLERQQQLKHEQSDNNTTSLVARLEAQEAKESMTMHLEILRKEEQELIQADQALSDEKSAHIRALKRVESEDASRFHHRPKLHNRYVLDRLLGRGGFSEVWRGFDLNELREVAVKIHQLDPRWPDTKKDNYTKHVTREYEIHRDVRHPRIVSLYDVFEIDSNSFATVLECCRGSDLDTMLKSRKRLPERHARAILLQIISGMQYLSQPISGTRQGIIHYDLKPGNILFDEAGDAKITDFGLSKIIDAPDPAESMELTSQGAGTYWYLPPECFFTGEQVRISNKVDVWSIGVIFYQMLYGRRPFGEGQTQDKILADHTMLNAQDVQFPDKPVVSDTAKDFVRLCLTYDQAFRPTIAQLCENSYVLQE